MATRNLPGHLIYIDDLTVFNNKKFWEYVKVIYPSQLDVEKTYQSDNLAAYFNLKFSIQLCLRDIDMNARELHSKSFMADVKISLKNLKGQSRT